MWSTWVAGKTACDPLVTHGPCLTSIIAVLHDSLLGLSLLSCVTAHWQDGKRPDGTTLLPWAQGKPMAWDVTVPDTYAKSHIDQSSMLSCKQGSSEQDCKVWLAFCLSHLFASGS